MTEEKLKELGYYVVRVEDDDRYLWEVYANDELMFIENTKEKAYDRLLQLAQCLQI